jgi:hypothetical protein
LPAWRGENSEADESYHTKNGERDLLRQVEDAYNAFVTSRRETKKT